MTEVAAGFMEAPTHRPLPQLTATRSCLSHAGSGEATVETDATGRQGVVQCHTSMFAELTIEKVSTADWFQWAIETRTEQLRENDK